MRKKQGLIIHSQDGRPFITAVEGNHLIGWNKYWYGFGFGLQRWKECLEEGHQMIIPEDLL